MVSAKTLLGFKVPYDEFIMYEFIAPFGMKEICRTNYDKDDDTYSLNGNEYSVVAPYTSDEEVLFVGVDLGFVYVSKLGTGCFHTQFDCASVSLDMIAAQYGLEALAADLGIEYDDLKLFTVLFNS